MKFERLVEHFGERPYFELREVTALGDAEPKTVKNQLSQWAIAGKISRLRRGKYLLNEPYRKQMPSSFYISNCLLRPSYVSMHAALQFHALIPEAVAVVQAVSPKHGNIWETSVGTFEYRSIKQERFWGYQQYSSGRNHSPQNSFLMARPEKALVDLFYLQSGEWTAARLRQMRFQNFERVDGQLLESYAERFDSPKVSAGCRRFVSLINEEAT